MVAPSATRVAANTTSGVNERIAERTRRNIERYSASPGLIDARLARLEREWDIERAIEVDAPFMVLAGIALGAAVDRRFLLLSGFSAGMLLLHSLHGWYPLLPLLRRLGLRTTREIGDEVYALKAARGALPLKPVGTDRERADEAYRSAAWRRHDAMLPLTQTRVRRSTSDEVNRDIQRATIERIAEAAQDGATGVRQEALEREWDTERALQTSSAAVTLAGLALGALVHRRWLLLPALAAGFMLQHALQGWCPPLAILRRRGFRTAAEIERERHALRMLRGETP